MIAYYGDNKLLDSSVFLKLLSFNIRFQQTKLRDSLLHRDPGLVVPKQFPAAGYAVWTGTASWSWRLGMEDWGEELRLAGESADEA